MSAIRKKESTPQAASADQIQFGSMGVIIGVILDPGVIQARVIGNEVEHQAQVTPAQAFAQPCQRGAPSQKFNR